MKLTQRQKHMAWFMGLGALFWTLSVSGVLFMVSTPTEMKFVIPPMSEILEFYRRALVLTVPFGLITGFLMGLASLPNRPHKQIRYDTLKQRVCEHLIECDPKTRELIDLYAWAQKSGWSMVEESVRQSPEKHPYAAKLLARDAEIIEFKREG